MWVDPTGHQGTIDFPNPIRFKLSSDHVCFLHFYIYIYIISTWLFFYSALHWLLQEDIHILQAEVPALVSKPHHTFTVAGAELTMTGIPFKKQLKVCVWSRDAWQLPAHWPANTTLHFEAGEIWSIAEMKLIPAAVFPLLGSVNGTFPGARHV